MTNQFLNAVSECLSACRGGIYRRLPAILPAARFHEALRCGRFSSGCRRRPRLPKILINFPDIYFNPSPFRKYLL